MGFFASLAKDEIAEVQAEAGRWREWFEGAMRMVDYAPVGIMWCNAEDGFTVTYANSAAQQILSTVASHLAFPPDQVSGKAIDFLFPDRALAPDLRTEARLPFQDRIAIGDQVIDVQISSVKDNLGKHHGAMVCMTLVTHLSHIADELDSKVSRVTQVISKSAYRLEETAKEYAAISEQSAAQSSAVAASSEQAASNVETAAAAAEELSASSREIGNQVDRAGTISRSAAAEAAETDRLVGGLADAAMKIGDVVSLINDIASQTNLLALNATIEAARAGDAGKGFAVVANEVKGLANQTAKATDEISSQISEVQAQTRRAVEAIRNIGRTIGEIDEVSAAIATAVSQQSAATQEIARTIHNAHEATVEVARNTEGILAGADQGRAAARKILDEAKDLNGQIEGLEATVDTFFIGFQKEGMTLEWGQLWETGNKVIDDDHRKLVGYVNRLSQAMLVGQGKQVVPDVLPKLIAYTHEHFAREEKIWAEGGLKSLPGHQKAHADLLSKVDQLQRDIMSGKSVLTTDMMAFLREWLINHVFKTDKPCVSEINRKAG